MLGLAPGESITTYMLDRHGKLLDEVVVEREEQDSTGVNIRYMVETVRP